MRGLDRGAGGGVFVKGKCPAAIIRPDAAACGLSMYRSGKYKTWASGGDEANEIQCSESFFKSSLLIRSKTHFKVSSFQSLICLDISFKSYLSLSLSHIVCVCQSLKVKRTEIML